MTGYCTDPIAISVDALGVWTDLIVTALAPGTRADMQLPVSVSEGRPYTWVGGRLDHEELHYEFSAMSSAAIQALEEAWHVTVIDAQWAGMTYCGRTWNLLSPGLR